MGFRLLALFGFFTVILTAIGALIGGLWGLRGSVFLGFAFFLVSLAVNSLSYWYSPKIILGKYKAKPSEDRDLNGMVERLAINAKIPKPGVYVLPIDVPNSFAAGKSKDDASVCVTEGLLSMNKGEIESVISHEIYHIVNNDILIQDVTAVIADILRSTILLIPLAVFLVKLAISESREYRADYYGSRISGKPKDLASALSKMNEITRQNPMGSSPAFECLWAVNPFRREGLEGMFSTHPPAARRVKRVEEMEHEGIPEPPEATEVDWIIGKKLERIDNEIDLLRRRIEFGGPEANAMCRTLENVLRDLKAFDQKRHRTEQMENDLNKRFEAIVLSLEKITKILKENGLI